MGVSNFMDAKRAQEAENEKKVLALLSNIPNLLVRVSVEINTVSSVEKKTTVDPKNVIQKETEQNEKTQESNQTTPGQQDPGVTANDACSGDISTWVSRTGEVNAWAVGVYTVTYNVTDAGGNSATPVTRTVEVVNCPW